MPADRGPPRAFARAPRPGAAAVWTLGALLLSVGGLRLVTAAEPPAAVSQPASAPATQPDVLAEFPIYPNEPLFVPVTFRGRQHLFILDTGATVPILDKDLDWDLGPPARAVEVTTPDGPVEMKLYRAPDARLGRLSLADGRLAMVSDFAMLRAVSGREVRGVVGVSLLHRHVLRLDFDRGRGSILPADRQEHPDWGTPIPIEFDTHGNPRVYVRVGGGPEIRFALDTGSTSSGDLHQIFFDRLVRDKSLPVKETLFETLKGTQKGAMARFPELSLGPLRYRDIVFAKSSGYSALGLDFLARHVVTADFANGKLYLRKGRRFEARDDGGESGLHLVVKDGRVVVHSVDKDSPAAKADVRAEDVIIRFNDEDAMKAGLGALRAALRVAGAEVRLTFRRGDQERAATVTVAEGI